MSDTITALAVAADDNSALAFSSMKADSVAEKAALFNAISNPAHKLGDFINKTIFIKDIYAELIDMPKTDADGNPVYDADGEQIVDKVPRIVLIDADGDTYQAVSLSVMNNITRLFKMFGAPTWEPALPVEVKQISRNNMRIYAFEVRTDLL